MDFTLLLKGFLHTDNAIRRAAEKQIQDLKVHRDALPLELLKVRANSHMRVLWTGCKSHTNRA